MEPSASESAPTAATESAPDSPRPVRLTSLTGVYHAEGTLRGELAYVVGKALGRAHCALCDITHGTVRERPEWKACRAGLPVPFATVHLDERSPEVAAATDGWTPCVVAHTADGQIVRLLGPDDLEACGKDPAAMVAAVERAADGTGLTWT